MPARQPRQPPGAAFNAVNVFLHHPVAGHIVEGLHWTLLCLAAGLVAPFVLAYKCVRAIRAAMAGELELAETERGRFGIFISGCDSGFGKTAALSLEGRGYTVFAGCLTPEGGAALREAAAGGERLVPVALDVTKDASVDAAVTAVDEWLGGGGRRALLSVVCNAGLAAGGPIDWLAMSDFESNINVNFYGVIRLTKALLPALKRTAAMRRAGGEGAPPQPRFVINSSIAGKLRVESSPLPRNLLGTF